MTFLVALAGVLALGSGCLKIFGKGKTPGAVPLFALLEILAGMGVPLLVWNLGPSPGVSRALLILLLTLVMVSSISRALELKARRRRRELSESARLATYVNHFSALKDSPEDPPPGSE